MFPLSLAFMLCLGENTNAHACYVYCWCSCSTNFQVRNTEWIINCCHCYIEIRWHIAQDFDLQQRTTFLYNSY